MLACVFSGPAAAAFASLASNCRRKSVTTMNCGMLAFLRRSAPATPAMNKSRRSNNHARSSRVGPGSGRTLACGTPWRTSLPIDRVTQPAGSADVFEFKRAVGVHQAIESGGEAAKVHRGDTGIAEGASRCMGWASQGNFSFVQRINERGFFTANIVD